MVCPPLLNLLLLAAFCSPALAQSLSEAEPALSEEIADIHLGVIHPMGYNNFTHCSKHSHTLSALSLAYKYAVSAVNNDSNLLSNMKLGLYIGDSCSSELRGLAIARRFRSLSSNKSACISQKAVVGVLGCLNSACSISVSRQLQLAGVPQISPLSTAAELSDTRRHPLFLRMVPSGAQMAQAMVDLLRHFNFSYINVIYSQDNYGQSLYQEFKRLLARSEGLGVCFGLETGITSVEQAEEVIARLRSVPEAARIVLLLTKHREGKAVLKAHGADKRRTFLLTDSFVSLKPLIKLAPDAVLLTFQSRSIREVKEFALKHKDQPWMPSHLKVS